jgi:methionyl-tRNA formyltransferase
MPLFWGVKGVFDIKEKMLKNVIIMSEKVIFMGTPAFSVPSLNALIESDYRILAVFTQPDREAGRGRKITMSPVKELAVRHNIPVVQPTTLKDPEVINRIAELRPDTVVVASYGKFLPSGLLNMPPYKCINLHPSLLPKYRGSSPISTAILNGDKVTGVTIMIISEVWDSGPILSQQEVAIEDMDTTEILSAKLAEIGARLLVKTMPEWFAGKITPRVQDESKVTLTRMWNKEDGRIDWAQSSVELWRKVRAFDPWPGCYTHWEGKTMKITGTVSVASGKSGTPGTVVQLPAGSGAEVGIVCGSGILGLLKVQIEGKKEMNASDFIRGQRDFIGSLLS